MEKKAVLVVSFGTSYRETRQKTIGAIEEQLQRRFADYEIYRAFTSERIRKRLEMEGVLIDSVEEAFDRMQKDGVKELIIQPTYIMNGMEYDKLVQITKRYASEFKIVRIGCPLLMKQEDYVELAYILKESFPVQEEEILVLMGHGSEHSGKATYPVLDEVLEQLGFHNIYVGTIEGYPGLDRVISQMKKKQIEKVCLAPMLIVAGRHANRDMIQKKNSWKNQLEREGYQVRYQLRGLGEIDRVQQMFVKKALNAEPIEGRIER